MKQPALGEVVLIDEGHQFTEAVVVAKAPKCVVVESGPKEKRVREAFTLRSRGYDAGDWVLKGQRGIYADRLMPDEAAA